MTTDQSTWVFAVERNEIATLDLDQGVDFAVEPEPVDHPLNRIHGIETAELSRIKRVDLHSILDLLGPERLLLLPAPSGRPVPTLIIRYPTFISSVAAP
ncbi:MAG: hypothetical protein ACOX52_21265 [Verrucomicrobiota bacterium]